MEPRQEDRYNDLIQYINELHEKNRKNLKASAIALVSLPVVLGLIRWLTDSDKTVFLMIWVVCMFLLAAFLVRIEYVDYTLYRRLKVLADDEEDPASLLEEEKLSTLRLQKRVRERFASNAADDAEEGGGE